MKLLGLSLGYSVFASTVLLTLTARGVAAQDRSNEPPVWNRESAANYLDERMDVWFAKAKKLQAGKNETDCISCHTTVPYMLSRPALRRVMHVSSPTPQEVRLIDAVTRRVQTYDDQELLYDFSEQKEIESRGTEAVLNALVLAAAQSE